MLLSIGLLATLMEIPEWWTKLTLLSRGPGERQARQAFGIVWTVMGGLWILWAWVFWRAPGSNGWADSAGAVVRD